jgi:hypothetical protein
MVKECYRESRSSEKLGYAQSFNEENTGKKSDKQVRATAIVNTK